MVQTFLRNEPHSCQSGGEVYLTEHGAYNRQDHYGKIHRPISAGTMFEYNNKLLDLQPKVTEEDVKNMTEEQKTEMLLKLLANK